VLLQAASGYARSLEETITPCSQNTPGGMPIDTKKSGSALIPGPRRPGTSRAALHAPTSYRGSNRPPIARGVDARHGEMIPAPRDPMSLASAEFLIRRLLSGWLTEKKKVNVVFELRPSSMSSRFALYSPFLLSSSTASTRAPSPENSTTTRCYVWSPGTIIFYLSMSSCLSQLQIKHPGILKLHSLTQLNPYAGSAGRAGYRG